MLDHRVPHHEARLAGGPGAIAPVCFLVGEEEPLVERSQLLEQARGREQRGPEHEVGRDHRREQLVRVGGFAEPLRDAGQRARAAAEELVVASVPEAHGRAEHGVRMGGRRRHERAERVGPDRGVVVEQENRRRVVRQRGGDPAIAPAREPLIGERGDQPRLRRVRRVVA